MVRKLYIAYIPKYYRMIRFYLSCIGVALSCAVFGQDVNLIKNGDFEEYTSFYGCRDNLERTPFWVNPTTDTPDFMHALDDEPCGGSGNNSHVGVPLNWLGYQYPQSGDGYIALHTYVTTEDDPEYARTFLDEPLYIGQTYTFTMYIAHANEQRFYTNGLGVYFSNSDPSSVGHDIFVEPHFYVEEVVYPDTLWKKCSWTFTADRGFNTVTLGRFFRGADDRFIVINSLPDEPLSSSWELASYYIDNVSLVAREVPELDLGEDIRTCNEHTLISPIEGDQYRWSTGSSQSYATITESGMYWLEITRFGEVRRDSIHVEIINDYNLYPVPTSNNIYLDLASEEELVTKWEILDMAGRLVKHGITSIVKGRQQYDVNLWELESGVYFYRFTTPCGEVVVERVVIIR